MATLAELQALREKLRNARASGVRSVDTEGKRVEYRTDAEMAAAIAALDREIAAASATPVRTVLISSSKGLGS